LRLDDVIELLCEIVHEGNDLIPFRHFEGPARAKVVLQVNDEKCIHDSERLVSRRNSKLIASQ
jgi:hypothetical protein